MKCPSLHPLFVVSDEPKLAAQISCALALPGHYLPIVDGPRLTRPDASAEVVRRNNAAARARAKGIILAGVSDEAIAAFQGKYPGYRFVIINDDAQIADLQSSAAIKKEPLRWGSRQLGIGLLAALRAGSSIVFEDAISPQVEVQSESGHLVVCEQGEDLSEIIAANYAFATGAGLHLIPAVDENKAGALLEALYSLLDTAGSPTQRLEEIKQELRLLCGPLHTESVSSLTFFSAKLPFGFAFPEAPSTHLFTYPDVGIAVVNGFSAEQPDSRGANIAILVDPETTEAPEINDAAAALAAKDTFVRVYRGPNADVTSISDAMEHFPYDILLFATHCGDASGYLWTYEFAESDGRQRELVVEVTPGIGRSGNPDEFRVTEYMRICALDGVDWDDTEKKAKMDVGNAIPEWMNLVRNEKLKPVKREPLSRVRGSAVLRMHDNNMVVLHQYLAHKGAPIVMTNACASWHELAGRLMFQNARAYIGTLFPVLSAEAHPIAVGFFDTNYGRPLAEALWCAQNAAYGTGVRRPYVISGVYPQVLRTTPEDHLAHLQLLLSDGETEWQALLAQYESAHDTYAARKARETLAYYRDEAAACRAIAQEMKRT